MLYFLFEILSKNFDFPGSRLFNYLSFRASLTAFLSLFLSIVLGKKFIDFLKKRNITDDIREDSIIQNKERKKNTPSMGGIIIAISTLIPTILFANLRNIYTILLIVSILIMSIIGFLDDYIKIFKRNKDGLAAKLKLAGQFLLGAIVGCTLFFHPDILIRKIIPSTQTTVSAKIENPNPDNKTKSKASKSKVHYQDIKSTKTNIPFFKNNELDYEKVFKFCFPFISLKYIWILYVLFVILTITSVSNAVNLTDGLDGLAASTSSVVIGTLGVLAYLSGNIIFSNYLNILYIPGLGELTIVSVGLVGACIGFLWYNTYPAQIIMGDTGSLTIGGVIAVMAICIRKELLLPILCGVFLIETLSVIIQVTYFKYTKKRYGKGIRVFKMTPLHHHYQQQGIHEAKIVSRFLIINIILAICTLVTLKIR